MYFVKVLSKKILQPTGSSSDTLFRLAMAYDGSGRRISKTRWVKSANSQDWEKELETHYTGIGTEIRESFTGAAAETKVVVSMPNGLGRYGIEDATATSSASKTFEWYLKNHLGSTMLVYGTVVSTDPNTADIGETKAAYDYRAFGEMIELMPPSTDKVTENFTGKEHDDEIALNYFGARYLDPMLGMWISVDPARQYHNPYLYANNNPVLRIDPDGNQDDIAAMIRGQFFRGQQINTVAAAKSVPSAMGPFVKNSVVNAANRVGSAMKETILFVEPAVTVAELGIPVACALMGAPVSAGLLVAFAGYNAVNSGLKYGIEGSFSSMVIDGAFILAGSKFSPGGRITNALVGGSYKRAADNALQNILNFGTHEIDGMLRQINDVPVNMDMTPEKSSSMTPMEDDN
jgi:RHS repeat-associated protein